MMRATVIVCGVLLGVLLACIIAASGHGNVLVALREMAGQPWGLVTLMDLGVGLVFVATWMAVVEPSPLRATIWILCLFALGNVVTLVFLIWRSRRTERFRDLFLPS